MTASTSTSYTFQPLGDTALLIDFGNRVDEKTNDLVVALYHAIRQQSFVGLIEAVPAYSSLAVFYDIGLILKSNPGIKTAFEIVKETVEHILSDHIKSQNTKSRYFEIPVCYATPMGVDLNDLSDQLHLSADEIIHLHSSKIYRVYMMGFLPGFPYMGDVDEKLRVPRKNNPVHVMSGSVGLAGKQTGIYPLDSPGGWQVIGRTPMKLFEKEKDNPVLLRAGDQIKFYSITTDEFENYQGGNS